MLGGIGRIRDLGNAFDWRRVRPLATPANANVLGLPAGQQRGTIDPRDVIRRSGEFTDPDEAIAFSHASGQKDINNQPIPRLSNLSSSRSPQTLQGLLDVKPGNTYRVGQSAAGPAPSSRQTDDFAPQWTSADGGFGPRTLRRSSTPAANNQSSVTTEFTPQRYEGEQARERRPRAADQADTEVLGAFLRRWGAGGYQSLPTGATRDPDTRRWRNRPALSNRILNKRAGMYDNDPRDIPDRGIGPVLRGEKDWTYVMDPHMAHSAPTKEARKAWGEENPNVSEFQTQEGQLEPETRAILEEYSRGMINETDVRPEKIKELRGGEVIEFTQIPGVGRFIPHQWSNEQAAYGPVTMQYRYYDAQGKERFEARNVYPNIELEPKLVDPDARWQSDQYETQYLGSLVRDERAQGKTPLMSGEELRKLYDQGQMEVIPKNQRDRNLIGYLKDEKGGRGKAVYQTQIQGANLFRIGDPTHMDSDRIRENIANPKLSGSYNPLSTRVKRIGAKVFREPLKDAEGNVVRDEKGNARMVVARDEKGNARVVGGKRVEEGFVPFLNRKDVYPQIGGLRKNKEAEPFGMKFADVNRELSEGSWMENSSDPGSRVADVEDAYRRILATAVRTGQMPVHVAGQGTTLLQPMRGTVASLRSGIDPITERRKKIRPHEPGTDSPQVTAGKQLRAALLDHVEATGSPVPQQEAIQWASAIGSRWGVDANSVLTAAADPANDPGRALFPRGSEAERLLAEGARAQRADQNYFLADRRVELDPELPIKDAAGNPIPTGARKERKIDSLLNKLRSQEGEGVEKITALVASGKLDSEETEILGQFLKENPNALESDFVESRPGHVDASGIDREMLRDDVTGQPYFESKGYSIRKEDVPVSDAVQIAMRYVNDPLGNPDDMKQAMYLGEIAEREWAHRRSMGREQSLENIMEELVQPAPVVRYERPDPIQAEAIRQRYQNYVPGASEIGGLKYPFQEGGYDRLADALGEEPGTPRHDAAMAHLVQRMQARQAGGETRGQYADKIAISEQASGVPQQLNLGVVSTDDSTDQLAAPAPQPVIDQTAPGVPLDNTPGVAELASTISSQRPQGRRPPDAPPLYRAGEIIPDELHNELLAQHLAKARGLI